MELFFFADPDRPPPLTAKDLEQASLVMVERDGEFVMADPLIDPEDERIYVVPRDS